MRLLLALSLSAVIAGCAPTAPPSDTYPTQVPGPEAQPGPGAIGCYVISWDSVPMYFPDTVALLPDSNLTGGAAHIVGGKRVLLTRHAWQAFVEGFAVSWWKSGPGDSIYIGRTDGFNGTTLRGRRTPDGITGRAASFTDLRSSKPIPTFPFHARPAACLGYRGPAT